MSTVDLEVFVTQERIDAGLKQSARGCPVALAIGDAAGGKAYVRCECVRIERNGVTLCDVQLPAEAVEWYHRYDAGEECGPFQFLLPVPADVMLECANLA